MHVKLRYVYWQENDAWIGYLEDFPDYWTQGDTEAELRENLLEIFKELTSGDIPNARRIGELEVT